MNDPPRILRNKFIKNHDTDVKTAIDVELDFITETISIHYYGQNNHYRINNICSATRIARLDHVIIKFKDILGCRLISSDSGKFLAIFYYPQIDIPAGDNATPIKRRRRHLLTLKPLITDCQEERSAEKRLNFWQNQIETHCLTPFHLCVPLGHPRRKLLAFINPFSGPGRALQIFRRKVLPVFSESGLFCHVLITEKALQAQEWARSLNLNEWHGLIVVSGDGLVFEVLNGLAMRDDALEAFKLPLGIIPGGSGNALAVSCCFSNKHRKRKFRRLLGSNRFFASGVARFANLRTHKGRLSFKLAAHVKCPPRKSSLCKLEATSSKSCPNLSDRNNNNRNLNGKIGFHEEEEDGQHELAQEAEYFHANYANFRGVSPDPFATKENVHRLQINSSNSDLHLTPMEHPLFTNSNYTPKKPHLSNFDQSTMPPLNQPVPDDWTQIEGDFYSVYLMYLSHLGSACPYMPYSKLDDDVMYLTVIRANTTGRYDLLRFLTSMGNGSHLDVPCVEIYPIVALRLERFKEDSILTVDGEHIKCTGPVQACLSRLKATVMTSEQCSS